jgi:hypothetical protein
MSRLVVVAYPSLSPEDHAWVQDIRAAHDELYFTLVEPHFTFVFPTEALDEADLWEHARVSVEGVRRIDFVLRCAVVWDDATLPYWHVFLVPEEGFSAIVGLHDRLYRGALASELRLDIPFIPHLGIGTSQDPRACKGLADRINREGVAIAGRIERLDVAVVETDTVRTIETVELA